MDTSELLEKMKRRADYKMSQSPTEREAMAAADRSGGSTSDNMKIVKSNAWTNGYYCAVKDMKKILDRGERTRD